MYNRCVCPEHGSLRRDGSCEVLIGSPSDACTPTHAVVLNVGTTGSPELRQAATSSASASVALLGILRRSVAVAVDAPASDIVLSEVSLLPVSNANLSADGLVHFDWAFHFCTNTGSEITRNLDGAVFESRLSYEAQNYVVFRGAVLRVLTLSPLESVESTSAPTPVPASTPIDVQDADSTDDARALLERYWWMPWALAISALATIAIVWVAFGRGRRRVEQQAYELDGVGVVPGGPSTIATGTVASSAPVVAHPVKGRPPGEAPASIPTDGPLVQIVCAFSLDEIASRDVASDNLLAVREGDMAEVLASAGGWLYGRILGEPERIGYFPEDRVAWVEEGGDAGAAP